MLKSSLIAAALFAAVGLGGAASPAQAQDMRAQRDCDATGYNCPRDSSRDSGVNRYCPPGLIPHSFPNGDGVRCQTQDGYWR